jgi:hypothetical protein
LEHFKKLQGNFEFHQNKCHPGGVTLMGWLSGDTLQEEVERNPKLKISGG